VPIFPDRTAVAFAPVASGTSIRYTTDGSDPSVSSSIYDRPFEITESATIMARAFWADGTASRASRFAFSKAHANPAMSVEHAEPGLLVDYYEQDGDWRTLPQFDAQSAMATTVASRVDTRAASRNENFGLRFRGFIQVGHEGVYGFHLTSDDGSRFWVDGSLVVDNDGVHGARERSGYVALAEGLHAIELQFFQGEGGMDLMLDYDGPEFDRREVEPGALYHQPPSNR